MNKLDIEKQQEIKDVACVLADLEEGGLKQACVASGYTRGWLTDTKSSDIDIAYVGDIHFEQAQDLLKSSISKRGLEYLDWDLNGIWNAELAHPEIKTTERHYLIHYVCSIDTVYLASDGKLYDPTGYGFEDSTKKVLRMNDFEKIDFNYKPKEIVYLCLEGCRRVAKFGWSPTDRSIELIRKGIPLWEKLAQGEKEYFYTKKIIKKFSRDKWNDLQQIYSEFGWGFIFDEVSAYE